jgi:3-deoxy-D-manno-octulosonic-acid transferase
MVFGIRIYSLSNKKAAQWIQDRKELKNTLFAQLRDLSPEKPVIWFHCASLGEFEMAKPIIEEIRKIRSFSDSIVVTFFSPSGYRNALKYDKADVFAYLYPDTSANAKRWIKSLRPDIVVWIKYEYWAHHLLEAKKSGARLVLANAHFSEKQIYFKLLRSWYLPILRSFEKIFTLDLTSSNVLINHGLQNSQLNGDTRIDRVLDNAQASFDDQHILRFAAKKETIVLGSVWPEDMKIISPALPLLLEKYNFIIAPHEISEHHISSLIASLPAASYRYSALELDSDIADGKILIIDNVGMLSKLYRVGAMAYVGGAFGKGLHNILEPLAYSIPVIFGPKIASRTEALDAINSGFGKSVKNSDEFMKVVESFSRKTELEPRILTYLQANKGASSAIIQYINNQ